MKTEHDTRRIVVGAMLAAIITCNAIPALGQTGKYMYKREKDDPWTEADSIEFRAGQYHIARAGQIMPIPKDKIYVAVGPKPVHFDKWATALKGGVSDAEAIRGMESVVISCAMIGWDRKALAYLFPAYENDKDYEKIIKACKTYEKNAGAVPPELQRYLWKALVQENKFGEVQKMLDEAKAGGSRDMVAAAYLVQGDIHSKKNKPDLAMYEGYLRVIICCADVKDIQAEALSRAWETMKAKGDGRHEKFRAKLLADFRQSKYAKMVE